MCGENQPRESLEGRGHERGEKGGGERLNFKRRGRVGSGDGLEMRGGIGFNVRRRRDPCPFTKEAEKVK